MILQFVNTAYKYPDSAEYIFENINQQFDMGFTGIIGSNGSGKSTLLKLVCGEIEAVEGSVNSKGIIYFCKQRTDLPPENFEDFLENYDKKNIRIRDLLGIKDQWFYTWNNLSQGERKKCQLAVALSSEPDILLIDEPTNHIDAGTRNVLINALKLFNGIGLIVSHDREMLDTLCTGIYSMDYPDQKIMKTNYSGFLEEKEKEKLHLVSVKESLTKEVKKLEREVKSRKEKVDKSVKKGSKKNLNRKDHDAKSKIDLGRLTGKDASENRIYSKLKKRMNDISDTKNSLPSTAEYATGISIKDSEYSKSRVLFLEQRIINLDVERKLIIPDLNIYKSDKIGVTGENGTGKTTLINQLVKELKKKEVEFTYIPQEITANKSAELLNEVKQFKHEEKGKIFTIISRLNSDAKRLLDSKIPSPGEVRKLMLAKALLNSQAVIIMDEPTNHLDLISIESVERALSEYGGTLILVSHDKFFLNNTVTTRWNIECKNNKENTLNII